MTHLPSLVLLCSLISEYWYYQVQTSVLPLTIVIAYRNLDFAKAFYHPLSFDLILCISKGSTWIGIKLTGKVNVFMLYISGKFHY